MRIVSSVACALLLTVGANDCLAGTITVADSQFANWSYSQTVEGGPDGSNFATIGSTVEGTNDILISTTHSWTSGKTAWGVAIFDGFVFDPGAGGALDSVSMSLDFKSGAGAFGNGQTLMLVVLQAGHYYGLGAGPTGVSSTWATHSAGPLSGAGVSWAGTTLDTTLQVPDFSPSGAPMKFGFAAGNHISWNLTNFYDNWSVTLSTSAAVPEPSTSVVLGFALAGAFVIRRVRRR